MPIDPQGNHSLPPGSIVTIGDNVLPSQHNPPLQDISATLSLAWYRDGRASATADWNLNGYTLLNMAASSSLNSPAIVGQTLRVGSVIDWALLNAPPGWLLCSGAPLLANTPYPILRQALIDDGMIYGNDGAGNPLLPDYRGRVGAGRDDMGGVNALRLSTITHSFQVGSTGGNQSHTLTAAQLAPHTHSGTTAGMDRNQSHSHGVNGGIYGSTQIVPPQYGSQGSVNMLGQPAAIGINQANIDHIHAFNTNGGNGVSGEAHNNVQPTIILNKIIKASYDG